MLLRIHHVIGELPTYGYRRVTAAKNLAEAFEHYNEWHPHSALGYR
ncbi:transposase, partial [Escherichia coli]|nr:transposase [Escherichia coli]